MKNACAVLSLLLLLLPLTVGAAITATYEPNPNFHFEKSFAPLITGRLVAHIGTLTFNTNGENFFDPNIIHVNLSTQFGFTGPIVWPNSNPKIEETFFHLYAVSTIKNKTQANPIWQGDGASPIRTDNGNLNVNVLVVQLYLVSDQPWSVYSLNSAYSLTTGTLGNFSVAVANQGGGYDQGGMDISLNGNPPGTSAPILPPGTSPTNPTIVYGDPPPQVNYDFSIINTQAINLLDGVGALKTKVADARIIVTNGQANTEYGVNVIFTNLANTNPFRLTMQDVNNPPSIPYSLYFNNKMVIPGGDNEWTGLENGVQETLVIQVTEISADDANQALAGYYQDTIVVNILPLY
ncbi:MAG: hypothetical protein RBQ65_08815 [Sphaerochaeta sp.]|nr:hypothetical protein [Sphaerochaeta sp.]